MQFDFFKVQPEKEVLVDCIVLNEIKYIQPKNSHTKRTWDYSNLNSNYVIFKTGGFNRFMPNEGNIFPKVVNVENGKEHLAGSVAGTDRGYLAWYFYNPVRKKTFKIKCHRLVAEAFLENDDPDYYTMVDHEDHNPLNYQLKNVRWVTPSQNALNAVKSGDSTNAILSYIDYKNKTT
jgi:hypothetical protein